MSLQEGEILPNKANDTHSIKLLWSEVQGRLWAVEVWNEQDFIHVGLMTVEQIEEHYQIPQAV